MKDKTIKISTAESIIVEEFEDKLPNYQGCTVESEEIWKIVTAICERIKINA